MKLGYLSLLWSCLAWPVFAVDVDTYIPPQAEQYKAIIDSDRSQFIPDLHEPGYLPALIEHESCISLTHSKCWNPNAELKTSREQGVGFGQLTRAYTKTGSLRFDKLEELRTKYKTHLSALSWSNIKQRPDLQIKAMTIMVMEGWNKYSFIKDPDARLAFTDASYNGGFSDINKDRLLCSLVKGCDPDKWFNNVEKYSVKSKELLYGNRSAYVINRNHVKDVLLHRLPKYDKYWYADDYNEYPSPELTDDMVYICPTNFKLSCVKEDQ